MDENQVEEGHPEKMDMTGGWEVQGTDSVMLEDDTISVDSAVVQPRKDLHKVLRETTQVAQGRCSKTIAYCRKKKSATYGMPTRKSSRHSGMRVSTPILERAMKRAEPKGLDDVGEC
jgi:hypothetical protein